jgi:hypothetical protein
MMIPVRDVLIKTENREVIHDIRYPYLWHNCIPEGPPWIRKYASGNSGPLSNKSVKAHRNEATAECGGRAHK